jgi:hypothetical protein
VNPVGWTIRNATRPVFHKGNSSKKEKEKSTKKEKENGLWKMPQLWKSAKQSVAFGAFFLMRIPTAAWKSLEKTRGFSTFTTGPATINQYGTKFHFKNYKGWTRPKENAAKHPLKGADGVVVSSYRLPTPSGFDNR